MITSVGSYYETYRWVDNCGTSYPSVTTNISKTENAGSDSLRGLFLARMRELYDSAATEEERAVTEQAARWGLAALDNREGV